MARRSQPNRGSIVDGYDARPQVVSGMLSSAGGIGRCSSPARCAVRRDTTRRASSRVDRGPGEHAPEHEFAPLRIETFLRLEWPNDQISSHPITLLGRLRWGCRVLAACHARVDQSLTMCSRRASDLRAVSRCSCPRPGTKSLTCPPSSMLSRFIVTLIRRGSNQVRRYT